MFREIELAKVPINNADVDFIVNEMELPRSQAERVLRENKGDLKATLQHLISV
jgi:NACalpha-BTF3-like transcription factor